MVNFTNITFDSEWIYADAVGVDYNVSGRIKINRKTEEYISDFNDINSMVHKAALNLLLKVERNKIKQNDSLTIAWG